MLHSLITCTCGERYDRHTYERLDQPAPQLIGEFGLDVRDCWWCGRHLAIDIHTGEPATRQWSRRAAA